LNATALGILWETTFLPTGTWSHKPRLHLPRNSSWDTWRSHRPSGSMARSRPPTRTRRQRQP